MGHRQPILKSRRFLRKVVSTMDAETLRNLLIEKEVCCRSLRNMLSIKDAEIKKLRHQIMGNEKRIRWFQSLINKFVEGKPI